MFHFLKANVNSAPPTTVNTAIVDGMFMLRACIVKCSTYQALAKRILQDSLKFTNYRLDICFDVYESPSIKDVERKVRGEENTSRIFSIGPKNKIEGNIKELLQLSSYKNELLRFLYVEYQDPIYAPLIHNKVFYCAINNMCMRFYVIDNELRYEEVPELFGSHLEADTRMMFHVIHSDNQDPGNIIVRANDADVLIILLANIHHLQNSQLWYDAGNNYDNSREYVDVNLLAEKINFRTALSGAYGVLGNDYTPAFFGRGKVKPLELVIKNQKFIDVLASLGEDELTEGVTAVIEEFVCWNTVTSVN